MREAPTSPQTSTKAADGSDPHQGVVFVFTGVFRVFATANVDAGESLFMNVKPLPPPNILMLPNNPVKLPKRPPTWAQRRAAQKRRKSGKESDGPCG